MKVEALSCSSEASTFLDRRLLIMGMFMGIDVPCSVRADYSCHTRSPITRKHQWHQRAAYQFAFHRLPLIQTPSPRPWTPSPKTSTKVNWHAWRSILAATWARKCAP